MRGMATQRTVADNSAVSPIRMTELGMPYAPYCTAIRKKLSKSLPTGKSQ